jgi:uncharacterized protein (DUF885 family)
MKKCLECLLCVLLIALPATLRANAAVSELHALFDAEWERSLRENPETATFLGDPRYNARWSDVSLDAIAASERADRAALERLLAIDRATLPEAEQLNYDLFRKQLEDGLAGARFRQYLIPLNQRGGVQTADEMLQAMRFTRLQDYEDWLARLRALPLLLEQTTTLMRTGIAERRLLPQVIVQRIPAQIERQLVAKAEDSGFYKPYAQMSDAIPARVQKRLRREAARVIEQEVVPAYRAFLGFVRDEYLPACPTDVGAWVQPDGAALYTHVTRRFTTTELTPDEIHEIGLKEVARIRGEMQKIIRQTGFKGDFAAFLEFLRTDPQFYYPTSEALFEGYLALSKRIDPTMPRLFRNMPRMPYGVRPIPDAIAPDTTTAYYYPPAADGSRAGYYYVNLYRPETRPKWEMEALSLHEAVPGHHFQLALQQELGSLPRFRQQGRFTAFVEGWGLYAESLGEELGFYQDPYSKFGQLTYEMWRAVRLVVDTGMHHKRWTRERAIAYFKDNAGKSELDITNEIDRYIAWPGQALAYKIGELRIKALRARASKALGPRFDVRDFHDVVLGAGALPLDILEQRVDAYIARAAAAR